MCKTERPSSVASVMVVVLVGALLWIPQPPPAGAQPSSYWCSAGTPTPCVASATLNGTPVSDGDPFHDVVVLDSSVGASRSLLWNVVTASGDFDLGASAVGDAWTVTLRTGSVVPRVAFTRGRVGAVERNLAPNTITITSSPVAVTAGCEQAAWPWTCPETAADEWAGYLGGEVTDYGSWDNVAQREAMNGYDVFTNVDATSIPAEILRDAATGEQRLAIRMANSHFRADGTTAVDGFMHQRIPNRFLRETYGIDNPATLTPRGLDPVLRGSGTGTVTVSDVGAALVVDASGMSFSRRTLRLDRGVITPRKPSITSAKRHRLHRARIRFEAGTARGSKVIRHQVRCRQIGGDHEVKRRFRSDEKIVVRGLRPGSRYWCKVRAISKAGPGTWSKRARVAPRP